MFVLVGIVTQTAFFFYYTTFCLHELSLINNLVLGCEIMRNSTKVFSYYYFRFLDNNEKDISNKNKITLNALNIESIITSPSSIEETSVKSSICSELRSYLYFNFAPTLIYSSYYPKQENFHINYLNFVINLFNCIFSLALCFLLYENSLFQYFKTKSTNAQIKYGNSQQTNDINNEESDLQIFFSFAFYTFLIFNLIFFGFAHSYHNMFADLINFSDRKFYDNFWNSQTPLIFAKKTGYMIYEFILYAVKPFLKEHFKFSEKFSKIILIWMVCFCLEFLSFITVKAFIPISSLTFLFCYFISFLLRNYYSDKSYLITLMLVTLGMATIVFTIFYHIPI